MKSFVILSVLVAGAMCARLDNTYIPPASAQSAGGYNLDTPKVAHASNQQNTYSAPGVQSQYQQQYSNQRGQQQGTFTSVQKGQGFQSVSAGSFSGNGGHGSYQAPQQQQQSYQQQSSYQQPQQQQSYNQQSQSGYNQNAQSGYNNQASTTPIPILKCKQNSSKHFATFFFGGNISGY
jgi:lipopolysaccharide export LptBFGC system permease protein LptF